MVHAAWVDAVKFKLNKRKPDDDAVLDLHRALYSRPGVVRNHNHHAQVAMCTALDTAMLSICVLPCLQATKRKRDILQFSGYVFGEEEVSKVLSAGWHHPCPRSRPPSFFICAWAQEKEKAKQLERLCKLTAESLGHICDILDLPQGGKKVRSVAAVVGTAGVGVHPCAAQNAFTFSSCELMYKWQKVLCRARTLSVASRQEPLGC